MLVFLFTLNGRGVCTLTHVHNVHTYMRRPSSREGSTNACGLPTHRNIISECFTFPPKCARLLPGRYMLRCVAWERMPELLIWLGVYCFTRARAHTFGRECLCICTGKEVAARERRPINIYSNMHHMLRGRFGGDSRKVPWGWSLWWNMCEYFNINLVNVNAPCTYL